MNLKDNSMRIAGIFLGLSVLWAAAAAAEERVFLFDGKTLKGWTVLKCQAEVDNGEILIKAGNGLVQSEQKYGDFVLELDWKALKQDKYDSGIYEGNVAGVKGAKSDRTDLIKPGDWNHFKLTVRGAKVELEINGTPAWKGEGLEGPKEGFIALQAEVPGGGQFRFRNIYLTK
jgi:hypothetical protein